MIRNEVKMNIKFYIFFLILRVVCLFENYGLKSNNRLMQATTIKKIEFEFEFEYFYLNWVTIRIDIPVEMVAWHR